MSRHLFLPFILLYALTLRGQTKEEADSVRQLNEIVVKAYFYNRPLSQIPASVGVLQLEELSRFNESTLVPSVNTIPGVRMEERSPGSYRLSIRGSTLRSPFGVRNVKIYWNNIPLTDPGGNTYLNQLDPAMLGSAEIIKGPGSSLYGAGTGGVMLLNSSTIDPGHFLKATLQGGSFGARLVQLAYEDSKDRSSSQLQVLHQQSDGYRDHTRMSRDVVNSVLRFEISDKERIESYIFYSDLFYETPGGLTLNEFNTNPKQSRPATATQPSAEAQRASVHLQSFYMGGLYEYTANDHIQNQTSVYGNLVKFENPSIRNYEHRNEQSLGARSITTLNYSTSKVNFSIVGGGEFQWGFSPIKTYENLQGREGVLQIDDEATILQYSLFAQTELRWKKFSGTAGLSYNAQRLNFHRLSDSNSTPSRLNYSPELMPRLAALFMANKTISVFGSLSRGFSPPTLAEINASNGVFNKALEPETGTNYEGGLRVKLFRETLQADITSYFFGLNETIVIRRENDGSEFFVNAGETNQRGIEFSFRYSPILSENNFIQKFIVWSSYSYNHYRFKEYIKGQDNFSGNQLTGTPKDILSGGIDLSTGLGIYLRTTVLYTGKLPINDANTVYADEYVLAGLRMGYQVKRFEFYAGGENLFDKSYSLGNDLNAFGGRYYNTAPARSFYGGVKVNLAF